MAEIVWKDFFFPYFCLFRECLHLMQDIAAV
jgi:hypothetical protein